MLELGRGWLVFIGIIFVKFDENLSKPHFRNLNRFSAKTGENIFVVPDKAAMSAGNTAERGLWQYVRRSYKRLPAGGGFIGFLRT